MIVENKKIFGIGLNKTGTTSLHQALTLLGIKSVHYRMPGHEGKMLMKTMQANRLDNKKLLEGLEGFQAYSDFRWLFYWFLDKQYPQSKFIITERELQPWLDSREKHVRYLRSSPGYTSGWVRINRELWTQEWYECGVVLNDYFKDRPSDVLRINICNGEGWEKLCPFLGVAAPDIPFPHKKDSSKFNHGL